MIINSVGFENPLVNLHEVQHEYVGSDFLRRLRSRVIRGDWKYRVYADMFSVANGILYQGTRVVMVMPENLRRPAFDLAHETHGAYQSTLHHL